MSDNDVKINQISMDVAEIKIMITMATDAIKKHNNVIYGNGKDGLLTRASLLEDDIKGFKGVKQKTNIMWWCFGILTSGTVLGLFIIGIKSI